MGRPRGGPRRSPGPAPPHAALRRDLGPRLREEGIDAGHMRFWDAHEELSALLRGCLAEPAA
jgi:hypothetical protein